MRNGKRALLFGLHMHQPVDNFDEAIQRGAESCYAPLFSLLKKYPEFKFSLHCSGWLLEKISREYKDIYDDMKSLSAAGSVEFLTAGYYEPVLGSIPSCDRVAQIEMLSHVLKRDFSQEPKGLWLTERVWESGVVADIVEAGVDYALVDDYHFIAAGFESGSLGGYHYTEESGKRLALFPISQTLRYAIPFKPAQKALEAVRGSFGDMEDAAIIFDDAEKFGMWPGTHEWVYGKGWLEEFIERVLEDEVVETLTYGEFMNKKRAKGIAYLPNVSYYEMGEWSLKADDALALERLREEMGEERFDREGKKFLKGGIWKNFFVKYEESNRLHKRMLESSLNRTDDPNYLEALYPLQTNDVFWHGVFGGLYLPNLRDNAYRYLTMCENLRYGKRGALERNDVDMDGFDEIKWVGKSVIMRFESRYGGQLVEFLQRDSLFNFQNVLTRRKEAYHEKILRQEESNEPESADEGISTIHTTKHRVGDEVRRALIYDWYIKNSFVDHISDHSLGLESFRECRFREFSDFANQPFELETEKESATFFRKGGIYDGRKYETTLEKRYDFEDDGVGFFIELESESSHIYEYGIEFNLHFADIADIELNGEPFVEGVTHELRSFTLSDPYTGKRVEFSTDHFFSLIATLLQTVSQSEEGYEVMTQGISLMAVMPFAKRLKLKGALKVKDV